jgi:hypothetical protein
LRVVGTLGRGDQQAEHESRHRPDQSHAELYDVFGITAEMVLGENCMKIDANKRAAKNADQNY